MLFPTHINSVAILHTSNHKCKISISPLLYAPIATYIHAYACIYSYIMHDMTNYYM